MIIKMKKTTIVCLLPEREKTLEKLRDLEVLHVDILKKVDSEDRFGLEQSLENIKKTNAVLSSCKKKSETKNQPRRPVSLAGKEICSRVLELTQNSSELSKRLEYLMRDRDRLLPWGDFSFKLITKLKEDGVFVYLCSGMQADLDNLPEGTACEVVRKEKKKIFFAVVSETELDPATLPIAPVPSDISLKTAEEEISRCRIEIQKNESELGELKAGLDKVGEYYAEISEKLEFATNRDGMEQSGELTYIQGYVPVNTVDKLKKAAAENGWALMLLNPEENDNPPTFIAIPKVFRIAKPIFDFIEIAPGYREWDVSVCFLFFFTIFFAMIIGDAGYGFLFLTAAIFAKFRLKEEKFRLPVNLFIMLSLCTIVWGTLSGSFFALSSKHLPWFMQGIGPLTNPETKNLNIQLICFIIAAVHLSSARVWKTIIAINSTKCLGEIGWMLLIWGNFFTAVHLMIKPWEFPAHLVILLYAIGFIFICCFGVNWRDIGEVLNFPFNLIGSFADVLSYIRLFALGLAGYYIADSFNNMSMMALDIPWKIVGVAVLIVILLTGHSLNIIMSLISVLVHAIRLNTLEFSNHMGLQWAGMEFKPFRKKEKPKN